MRKLNALENSCMHLFSKKYVFLVKGISLGPASTIIFIFFADQVFRGTLDGLRSLIPH